MTTLTLDELLSGPATIFDDIQTEGAGPAGQLPITEEMLAPLVHPASIGGLIIHRKAFVSASSTLKANGAPAGEAGAPQA